MGYSTHSMGSWVGSPQARRLMFMTIPEKYKLWSLVLCSKNFEKLVRIFFSKKYFLRKFFIEFPNKNIFSTHIFERKNRENINISRFFLSRKCWLKNYFVRKFNEKFSKKMFFRKKIGPTFRNFWIIGPHSKVYIFRGWSWTLTCELAGTKLNFPCCAWNIPYLIE